MRASARGATVPVLDPVARNRALLARQGLLERQDLPVEAAIERFGGLQAQEPASPFIALWARLRDVTPEALDDAFLTRRVVKAGLMRMTLHAVSAADYRRLRPALGPLLDRSRRSDRMGTQPTLERFEALVAALAPVLARPRLLGELREAVAQVAPGEDAEVLLWWVRRYADLIHAPSADEPWSFGRRPRSVDAWAWLGRPADAPPSPEDATDHLVRRYLAAFGPASAADVAAWSGLPVGAIRPALDRLDAEVPFERFVDERGRELLDLPEAPRPPADTPAPPRLLPMWDSILLAHADRRFVIGDAERAEVIARNGDTLPTLLVDGRVAGTWWAVADAGGRTRVELDPFLPLAADVRTTLEEEGERLAAAIEPVEPGVYGRYRRHRRPALPPA